MLNLSILFDSYLLSILFFTSKVSDYLYPHIYIIIFISILIPIILYSGPSKQLGQKIITGIGVISGGASIYTGGKEIYRDVKSVYEKPQGSKTDESTSKPVESTSKPSGSEGSSNTPSSSKT